MAKIILSGDGVVLREMVLSKDRVTIGRRPYNDVVIDDLAISGEHAVIVAENGDFFLEDLNSTNGTKINGQPVRKHFLRDQDVIVVAQYTVTYLEDPADDGSSLKGNLAKIRFFERGDKTPALTVMDGINAGKEILLAKPITTIGQPGVQVAGIAMNADGYFLTHIDGDVYPKVNGRSIGVTSWPLTNGDMIDLQYGKMQFSLT